ncbi:MAG: ABC transporter transmembrane domain-containing protein, partial [Thermotogota bacterium]
MNKPKPKSDTKKLGPKGSTWQIITRLAGYLSQYKGSMIFISLGFLFSTVLSLTPAWLVKISLDRFLTPEKVHYLWIVAAVMIGAVSVQGAIDFFIRYIAESRGQKVVYTIRQQLYRHFMRLSFSYYDKAATGDVMSRITADAETLQTFFGFASIHIIGNSLFIIGILVVM